MSVRYQEAEAVLPKAVDELFDADPKIQAVGIARFDGGFGIKAVRNEARVLPASSAREAGRVPKSIRRVPVRVESVSADIEPALLVPHPATASFVPEQQQHRLPACGLQVQNVDDDERRRAAGRLGPNLVTIGTLGCFVTLAGGGTAILSNNHVLGGENRGVKGTDRILQPGNLTFAATQHVATLTDFVKLLDSPASARPAKGNVRFNTVDAAVAEMATGVAFAQAYLPARGLPAPFGTAAPKVGDKVFKVGRTTGLTRGEITNVAVTVGPVPYDLGHCWFQDQFEITGDNGTLFSDQGDSGSVIVTTAGEVVGLLFAGNGTQTYASPIQTVLTDLSCTLT